MLLHQLEVLFDYLLRVYTLLKYFQVPRNNFKLIFQHFHFFALRSKLLLHQRQPLLFKLEVHLIHLLLFLKVWYRELLIFGNLKASMLT